MAKQTDKKGYDEIQGKTTTRTTTEKMSNLVVVTGRSTEFEMARKNGDGDNWQLRDHTATDVDKMLIEMPTAPTPQIVDAVAEAYVIAGGKALKMVLSRRRCRRQGYAMVKQATGREVCWSLQGNN